MTTKIIFYSPNGPLTYTVDSYYIQDGMIEFTDKVENAQIKIPISQVMIKKVGL